jgi:hypothetical protein
MGATRSSSIACEHPRPVAGARRATTGATLRSLVSFNSYTSPDEAEFTLVMLALDGHWIAAR